MTTLTPDKQQLKRPNLERQAILFTIGLYLFISASLLAVHYFAPTTPAPDTGSSSTSPYNPGS
ncbi:hypothetical protein [Nonomuraea endophytica]|uniref:Uncharacterized protein n=1 Tax=Nonomuraea endophytica TaxID=714136 RepID=A0A7W8AEW2_9ACTN|nr:hypothetical protein [Nonomuraea endophytica]MBB5084838.1 hypothetical protein [Nonomuraea endophytica]